MWRLCTPGHMTPTFGLTEYRFGLVVLTLKVNAVVAELLAACSCWTATLLRAIGKVSIGGSQVTSPVPTISAARDKRAARATRDGAIAEGRSRSSCRAKPNVTKLYTQL